MARRQSSLVFAFLLLALLGLLAPVSAAITGRLTNHCSFDVYVWTDAGQGGQSSGIVTLRGRGNSYIVPFQPQVNSEGAASRNRHGVTVKIKTMNDGMNKNPPVYQAEYSIGAGTGLWYNWSKEDGNNIRGVLRRMWVPGCRETTCRSNDDSCNWRAGHIFGTDNVVQCQNFQGKTLEMVLC